MKFSKSILVFTVSLLTATLSYGEEFLHLSIGALRAEQSIDGVGTNGFSTISLSEDSDDSGALVGAGVSFLAEKLYVSTNVYIPNTDDDTWLIFEVSPHYLLKNNSYVGVVIGYQNYESSDVAAAQSIGANQSEISLNGMTAGVSFGALFNEGRIDLNFKYRFVNGGTEQITGSLSGVSYALDLEVESTLQFTLGYNFAI